MTYQTPALVLRGSVDTLTLEGSTERDETYFPYEREPWGSL